MKNILLLCHSSDTRLTKGLAADLRRLVKLDEYKICLKSEARNAFGDAPGQLQEMVAEAWAVIVLCGEQGVDEDFANLGRAEIQQRILDEGRRLARLVILLPGAAELPTTLRPWVSIRKESAATRELADEVRQRLLIPAQWSVNLDMSAARRCLPEGREGDSAFKNIRDVAQTLADGKPLTIMVGPYASVEENDDGSCPSRIRQRLIDLIRDETLRRTLEPLEAAAQAGALPPLLWQDHLATLCLLSGCTRREVSRAIEEVVWSNPGDAAGAPEGVYASIGRLASALERARLPRATGLPGMTILTMCSGLRLERALVASGCDFERAALMIGSGPRPELHRACYSPSEAQAQRAHNGEAEYSYMPNGKAPPPADEIGFIRLVKLFGSRDLDHGVPSGDFGQIYEFLGQLRYMLEDFVAPVGTGPYLVLGGGLSTPPVQAIHSILLRTALEKPERRPRLALIPKATASADPLRRIESGRLERLAGVQNSGLDRLDIVASDPMRFLDALTAGFAPAPADVAA